MDRCASVRISIPPAREVLCGLIEFKTVVDPMAQHKNRAAEIQGLPMNLAADG